MKIFHFEKNRAELKRQRMQLVHKLPIKKPIETPKLLFNFNQHRRLIFKQMEGFHVLPFDQISYLKSESNYTNIFLKNGKQVLISQTLKLINEQLDNQFLRVHNSVIINLLEVESFNTKNLIITLFSGEQINVSRRKKAEVGKIFKSL